MECCLIKLLPYILFEKYISILPLEMASPGNQHCVNCIGTLSFPIANPNQGDDVRDGSFREGQATGGRYPRANVWSQHVARESPNYISDNSERAAGQTRTNGDLRTAVA